MPREEVKRTLKLELLQHGRNGKSLREARLRWYGHIQRREEDECVKRILEADVHRLRSRVRQRKRWTDVVKYNVEDLWLTVEDTGNRADWRRRIRVDDPSPEGSGIYSLKEREIDTMTSVWKTIIYFSGERGEHFSLSTKLDETNTFCASAFACISS